MDEFFHLSKKIVSAFRASGWSKNKGVGRGGVGWGGAGPSPGSAIDNLPDIGCPCKTMYDYVKVPQYDEMNFAQGQMCICHK